LVATRNTMVFLYFRSGLDLKCSPEMHRRRSAS
jgi:hypothetical protein